MASSEGKNKKKKIEREEMELPKRKDSFVKVSKAEQEIEKELENRISKETNGHERKKRLSKRRLVLAILLLLIILAPIVALGIAYFSPKPEPKIEKKEEKKEPEKKEEPVVEEPKVKIVDVDSTSRPFAIMINNAPVARPVQSGLQDAYIIYEMIVEGGVTRYMALFLDQNTERIGSVRSARHYYLDYALENDAIYVHHGRSPQAASDFGSLGVTRIEVAEGKTGWRDTKLNVAWEHKLFTSIDKLKNGMNGKRSERNKDLLLKYSIDSLDLANVLNSKPANKVSINYSNNTTSSYEYDEVEKVYKRFVNNQEHKDYVTGKQYTFKNIITYQVSNYTIAGDEKGRQTLNNIGSGSGYYISEGYAIPINWSKSSRGAQTKYTLQDGTELVVNDGNTFIQIQPKGRSLNIS